ncbi:MAG: NAD(P)-binding protein [Coriobacteriia bacterium]|nr:NAD(P)-binding protein [Coriobacteriia bacterium]
MRIAVVGAGIAGVGCAWLLSPGHTVDVYSADAWMGGHARTLDVTVGGASFPVDTGFQVFNERTYPNLIRFFDRLGTPWQESDMSFSVSVAAEGVEWSGTNLNTVFAQRSNALKPRFLAMLADVVRFSHDAERLLRDPALETMSLGDLLSREKYSAGFSDWYLIPMGAAIWSTPPGMMLDYPAATFLRFCDNHGLLHITNKPIWRSVVGGSRLYVASALQSLSGEAYAGEPVESVQRVDGAVRVRTAARTQDYDAVIIAAHPPETLAMLGADASPDERAVLGAIAYQPNDALVSTDTTFPPEVRARVGLMELAHRTR